MKKLVIALIAIAFIAGLAHAANNYTSVGFIDVQKVFKAYKETIKAQDELSKQEDAFKKEFEESQKKLEKAQKDGKKEEEIEKMKKEFETKLAPKRDSLLKLNEQLTSKLQLEILDAVKKVGKKVGIELVLDKQVVITGGMDLSEMVINELNK
ncbi:MAG: OmpH family outer membrane protein [Candidatus Margulisbacteria bacterium]|nr:OmpH family outer membrane protein [Candidatus Margulisiibacteriota bacterium]